MPPLSARPSARLRPLLLTQPVLHDALPPPPPVLTRPYCAATQVWMKPLHETSPAATPSTPNPCANSPLRRGDPVPPVRGDPNPPHAESSVPRNALVVSQAPPGSPPRRARTPPRPHPSVEPHATAASPH